MKLTLQPESEYMPVIGEGKTFGEAAKALIDKVIFDFDIASLNDGILFRALGKVQEVGTYQHWQCGEEDNFTLTLEK